MPPLTGPEPDGLHPVLRTAAYAVVRQGESVLLARASERSDFEGRWFLPGGGVRHGEHPRDGVLRELLEETGVVGARPRALLADSDVIDLPHRGARVHTLRLLYDVTTKEPPVLRAEADDTTDEARFVTPEELRRLPLMPFVARVLGLPADEVEASEPKRPLPLVDLPRTTIVPDPGGGEPGVAATGDAERPVVVQRPAAYAALFQDERVLLAHVTGSNGTWTLPGGGIDFGEHPVDALIREMYEETGLPFTPGPLLDVISRHFTGRAPTGRLEDFHGISLVYSGSVPVGLEPRVTEVDGSTDAVAWHHVDELDRIRAVATVHEAVRRWRQRR
ncbi:NUDIX hydrolase [Spongisporangium articulatum]|uniref:NUDIX hydrolase n=1 Tax=Spongisporangium articulatum TaxID=3362603 RepID=A0ABW8AP96_9ACTN